MELCLSDGIISDENAEGLSVSYGPQCPTIYIGMPGDVNGDSVINILDVVGLVNIILGISPENPAGDLNQDGVYNVLDIVQLVNIILDP